MKNNINVAVVGLGQVGSYLLNELNIKKKDIELKTGKKINVVAVSARNINKKRQFKIDKKIFFKNPLEIFNKKKVDILFEAIGQSDGISKKIVETALKNITHWHRAWLAKEDMKQLCLDQILQYSIAMQTKAL